MNITQGRTINQAMGEDKNNTERHAARRLEVSGSLYYRDKTFLFLTQNHKLVVDS